MSGRFDVVVVGTELNALVAACYLSRDGRRVLVLDEGVAGEGGDAPDFLSAPDPIGVSPMLRVVIDELDLAGVDVLTAEAGVVASAQGGALTLWSDVRRTAESLAPHSRSDAAAWPGFVESLRHVTGFLERLWLGPPPDPLSTELGEMWRSAVLALGLRRRGSRALVDVMRLLPMSVAELLDDFFECDLLKGTLAAVAVQGLGQGPMAAGTAHGLLHRCVGAGPGRLPLVHRIAGGYARLGAALRGRIEATGGEIRRGVRVASILVSEGRTAGVVLEDGVDVSAPVVVSGADPQRTFLGLIDPIELEPGLVRAVRNVRSRGVVAVARVGLSEPLSLPTELGGREGGGPGIVSFAPDLVYVERAYDAVKYRALSESPVVQLHLPAGSDGDSRQATAFVQYAPVDLVGGWGEEARQRLDDSVRTVLEPRLAGWGCGIDELRIETPQDLEAGRRWTGGHPHQVDMTLDQLVFMRPVPELARYRAPVTGLYLCGPGCHPGGGLHGMQGRNCARAVQEDQKRGGPGVRNQL